MDRADVGKLRKGLLISVIYDDVSVVMWKNLCYWANPYDRYCEPRYVTVEP